MLELRNVTMASRGITRLNFSVAAGEIVALIGRNGAGKTTLLRLALGLIRPTAGMVRRTVSNGDIGQLIDAPFCYPELTVAQNLRMHVGYMASTLSISPTPSTGGNCNHTAIALSETVARKQATGGFSWGVSASATTYRA